jgi:hypothetical protein
MQPWKYCTKEFHWDMFNRLERERAQATVPIPSWPGTMIFYPDREAVGNIAKPISVLLFSSDTTDFEAHKHPGI